MYLSAATVLAFAASASAHFTLLYPQWRASSFVSPASQWIYPCAGVNSTATSPRTLWPLKGGAIAYNNSHEQVYAFFNLGLGNNVVNLNYSLTGGGLIDVNGAGVFCLPNFSLPSGLNVTEGTNATIQVINLSSSGAALYNCADITFSANAPVVPGATCANSTGVTASVVTSSHSAGGHSTPSNSSSHGSATNTSTAASTTTSARSGASGYGSSVSTVVVGVAAVAMSYFL